MTALVSLRQLAHVLGVPLDELKRVAADINPHYHEWLSRDSRTGKVRTIRSPSKELKAIQGRIARRLFRTDQFGQEVQGGVRGRSPKTNADLHLGKPYLVAIDVRKYFPSVRHTVVFRMLRDEFGYGRDVAALVTRLVTHDGQLPQGAPTSTAIANLLLRLPVDGPVLAAAERDRTTYTRFIDDLALSGQDPRNLINLVARQLSKRQLAISRKAKLKIMPNSRPQEITGLLVNGRKPSLSKTRRDLVRSAIHHMKELQNGGCQHNKELRSVEGRIAYVRRFNPGSAKRLERQLEPIK